MTVEEDQVQSIEQNDLLLEHFSLSFESLPLLLLIEREKSNMIPYFIDNPS